MKQFEHSVILTEERVAGKLQLQLQAVNKNTLQVFLIFFLSSEYYIFPIEFQNVLHFSMQGTVVICLSVCYFSDTLSSSRQSVVHNECTSKQYVYNGSTRLIFQFLFRWSGENCGMWICTRND